MKRFDLYLIRALGTLLKDFEAAVSAQALEDVQDMVFDQTLKQIAKGHIKYLFLYQDELMDCSVIVLGNSRPFLLTPKGSKLSRTRFREFCKLSTPLPKVPQSRMPSLSQRNSLLLKNLALNLILQAHLSPALNLALRMV